MSNEKTDFEAIVNEEWVCLVAPDGTPQPSTLAYDFAQCVAYLKLLHKAKMGESPSKLFFRGFKILPVKISIEQNGNEEKAFQDAKNNYIP